MRQPTLKLIAADLRAKRLAREQAHKRHQRADLRLAAIGLALGAIVWTTLVLIAVAVGA